MLTNVKSIFFINYFFSFVEEARTLEITKYNKSLQSILNINIINYKIKSQYYIIFESNGKGKLFDAFSDILYFEGEYLNGKKNGKGEEYDLFGDTIFKVNI